MPVAVSNTYKNTIINSHQMAVRVEVWNGTAFRGLVNPLDGNVSADNSKTVRRDAWISVGDPTLVPSKISDLVVPFTNELRIFRGAYLSGVSNVEFVPLGRFYITDVEIYDSHNVFNMRVSTQDYASRVADAKFQQDYVVQAGV